jgi:limonene-1,2-epoxide hydrolase
MALTCLPALADTDEAKLATALEMVDAWNKRDWERVYALFADDGVLHSMMMEPVVGRENIRERLGHITPGVEQIELQLQHIGIVDDVVVLERVDDFTYYGTHSRVPVVGVMEIDNGLVTVWREYYDHASLARALTTPSSLQAKADKTETAIIGLTEKLQTDWNDGDMEAYLAAYWNSENTSLMFGDKAVRGWETVATMFRNTWTTEENMGNFSTHDVVVRQITADTAISSGGFQHVFPKETIDGSFTHVWKLFEDGRWLIVHEHTSRKNLQPASH